VVTDFTQCAAACAHRIKRHKTFTAQCNARLRRRGACADATLQVARTVAKDRLAMRRTTYSLLTSALHARDGCTAWEGAGPGRAEGAGGPGGARFDVSGAVAGVQRGSAAALAAAEAGIPAAAADESEGDMEDHEEMVVAAVERVALLRDAGAAAAADAAAAGVRVTRQGFDALVLGATVRADGDNGAAERDWLAAVRAAAAGGAGDGDGGLFSGSGVRLAADDPALPPAGYLRHDLGAELAFPMLYASAGLPVAATKRVQRAVERGAPGLAHLAAHEHDFVRCAVVGNSQVRRCWPAVSTPALRAPPVSALGAEMW